MSSTEGTLQIARLQTYDALFLALAEDLGAVMVTANTKLLDILEGTPYAHLAHSLADVASLIPSTG